MCREEQRRPLHNVKDQPHVGQELWHVGDARCASNFDVVSPPHLHNHGLQLFSFVNWGVRNSTQVGRWELTSFMYKKRGVGHSNFGLEVAECQTFLKVEVSVVHWLCLHYPHDLYCIARFDCVWFLGKVSAHVHMRLEVKMPRIVHIMPLSFYNFRLILELSKR